MPRRNVVRIGDEIVVDLMASASGSNTAMRFSARRSENFRIFGFIMFINVEEVSRRLMNFASRF